MIVLSHWRGETPSSPPPSRSAEKRRLLVQASLPLCIHFDESPGVNFPTPLATPLCDGLNKCLITHAGL
jgi:hypothetical protein